jgi:hypothetical protein
VGAGVAAGTTDRCPAIVHVRVNTTLHVSALLRPVGITETEDVTGLVLVLSHFVCLPPSRGCAQYFGSYWKVGATPRRSNAFYSPWMGAKLV